MAVEKVGDGVVVRVGAVVADVPQAVADVVAGKAFDNGLLCSAENSLICDKPVEERVRQQDDIAVAPVVGDLLEKFARPADTFDRPVDRGLVLCAPEGLAETSIGRWGVSLSISRRAP